MEFAGVPVDDIDAGFTPLEVLVVVKCLDTEGQPTWVLRTSPGMNQAEVTGVLNALHGIHASAFAHRFRTS